MHVAIITGYTLYPGMMDAFIPGYTAKSLVYPGITDACKIPRYNVFLYLGEGLLLAFFIFYTWV